MTDLLALNPALDPAALARAYAPHQRLQVRDVLAEPSARALHRVLAQDTPWGLAWQGQGTPPERLTEAQVGALSASKQQEMTAALSAAMTGRDYGFLYSDYPMLTAYLERWRPGHPLEGVLEAINSAPMLDFVRTVTGIDDIVKADAQATLFNAQQFLAVHDDKESERGRRVAYVLSLCAEDWREDWGGYLNFFDADGDVVAGYRPRFNALNLFTVPQAHNVGYVPWFAPIARFSITGWFRDR